MSAPSQGTSGPSGYAGSQPALGQSVSGNHETLEPLLTQLQRVPPEQSVSRQIRRLTVRLFVNVFDPSTNKPPSAPLKRYCCSMSCPSDEVST